MVKCMALNICTWMGVLLMAWPKKLCFHLFLFVLWLEKHLTHKGVVRISLCLFQSTEVLQSYILLFFHKPPKCQPEGSHWARMSLGFCYWFRATPQGWNCTEVIMCISVILTTVAEWRSGVLLKSHSGLEDNRTKRKQVQLWNVENSWS